MSIYIGGADLEGDWSPLLDRMPGWRREGDLWTSASSHARIGCARTRSVVQGAPSIGRLPDTRLAPASSRSADRFQLCHASYALPDLHAVQAELIEHMVPAEYFGRRQVLDSRSGETRSDAHLIEQGHFYITLFAAPEARLDHIGWWCPDRADVDLAANALIQAGWPIILGPTVVDGSYLVHFQAPDGRVHDVFAFEARP